MRKHLRRRERLTFIITFLLPACALYATFVLYPMARAFHISLYAWRGLSAHRTWVGLDNFRRLFADEVFRMCVEHNLYFLFVGGAGIFVLALFFAALLSRGFRGAEAFKLVYLFPNVMSIVAISVLGSFIYHPTIGVVNGLLKLAGHEDWTRAWLGEPKTALPCVVITYGWYSLGFYIVLFMAGMKNIPRDLYEAARIDGANESQSFVNITLPLLRETLKLGVVFLIVHALNVFALVYVMTHGEPSRHTEVLLTYLYEQAITNSDYGLATAMGVVVFVLVFSMSLLSMRLMKREVVEF